MMNASNRSESRNVVLVHAAYADGSSWCRSRNAYKTAGLAVTTI